MGTEPIVLDQSHQPVLLVGSSLSRSDLCTTLIHSHSWSAVVRGAVLYGVGGIVHSRKLKQHYGVKIMTHFIPGIHDEADSYIDPFNGTKLASSNVDWLAAKVTPNPYTIIHGVSIFPKDSKQGDDASVEKFISIPARKSFLGSNRKLVSLTLMGCKFDEPPQSSKHWSEYCPRSLYFKCS